MNWEALGAIAELLGAIGVILTLLYLSRQIDNNSKQLEEVQWLQLLNMRDQC